MKKGSNFRQMMHPGKLLVFIIVLSFTQTCDTTRKIEESSTCSSAKSEILYNGIELPEVWPPRYPKPDGPQDMAVPYLNDIPSVIPVNLGRQLFIDNFLIEETDLVRTFHYPEYYNENPILKVDSPWEYTQEGYPYAAPFSDGVWYDEIDQKYKMWYSTGGGEYNKQVKRFYAVTAYAESEDGIHWDKPQLDVVKGTNLVNIRTRDSNTMWLDKEEKDPMKRYKLFNVENVLADEDGKFWCYNLKYSPDGIHWSETISRSGKINDRSTVFYNPFRSKWVFSIRTPASGMRARNYFEHSDPEIGVSLINITSANIPDKSDSVVFWFVPWKNELRHPNPEYMEYTGIYNLDAIAYESLFLGYFSVWQGPHNKICDRLGIQKRNELAIGFSRDGFHWHRPDKNRFLPVNEADGAWNQGNIQSACGAPLIVGDSLYFYMSGRTTCDSYWDACSSTGLAKLRRDGFASMDAGSDEGTLLTRKLLFDGEYLFVNADASQGEIVAEVLDKNGKTISDFSKDKCKPIKINGTKIILNWESGKTLKKYSGNPIRIKFYLKNASLYSFWVSKYKTGESGGYTSGGGPGLNPSGRDLPQK
jgi:hypothetical protein